MGDADRPTDLAGFWNREVASANAAADRAERCLDLHGYGCDRAECGRGPVPAAAICCRGGTRGGRVSAAPCECGRGRATADHLARWCASVAEDRLYGRSPSTCQNVRLGQCLPPNEAHLDPVYPEGALALCW